MRVILHTGWRKTGSSAIQYSLDANRAPLRERYGINYPEAGRFGRAHHLAAWDLLGARPQRALKAGAQRIREGGFREMLDETARAGCATMVASSEVLSNDDAGLPERLAAQLSGHAVEVISYVRRQDHYVEARYNQRVKDGRPTAEIAAYVDAHLRGLDYYEHFRRWAAAFGRENVRARIYDRGALPDGDVRVDFVQISEIPVDGLAFEARLRNASLTFSGVQFLRRYELAPPAGRERRRLVRALERYARRHPDHSSLLDPAQRRAILERFRESNRRFAREFLDRQDVFELRNEELAAEQALDRSFGEERFRDMLGFVEARLGAEAARLRKRSRGRPGPPSGAAA